MKDLYTILKQLLTRNPSINSRPVQGLGRNVKHTKPVHVWEVDVIHRSTKRSLSNVFSIKLAGISRE